MDLVNLNIVDNDPELSECAFRIKSRQRVLDLEASSDEEKTEWITAIRDAVDEFETKRGKNYTQLLIKDS